MQERIFLGGGTVLFLEYSGGYITVFVKTHTTVPRKG